MNRTAFSIKTVHNPAVLTLTETQGGSVVASSDLDPGERF